ncbi:hypothetical protein A2V49_03035 [candidate division WWE3 bacterium RBG_19FT_COMBO_34_6]|uniref:Acyl carrier protein n=1 Tax=candidate division WWE3 bacterium RBG_19FT_COMBO_34_6 TaxID=1802612 RepID=A0A1F4UL21_UNCKA|nr:MAG: hypothetical protein A2V49_03035 [candidate division WWE3 bacterium RBG_19FT_COMBO_34_6]
MDKYYKEIKKIIIQKSGLEPEEINEESYFGDDLNIGHMELLDILTAIEEEYNIEFEENEKEEFETIKELVDLVIEKIE